MGLVSGRTDLSNSRPCMSAFGGFVPPDYLGLFDTPPTRRQMRFGIAVVVLMAVAILLTLPVSHIRWREIQPMIPVLDAIMFVGELIIAALLYAQAGIFRSRALTLLASAYVFAALLLVPHALTFPGAFSPDGLLGAGINTTGWLAMFRRMAFPIGIGLYAILKSAEPAAPAGAGRPAPNIAGGLLATLACVAAATMLAIRGEALLPPFFVSRTEPIYANLAWINAVTIALCVAAMVLLFRQRRSLLDMWLLVALSGWLLQSALNYGTYSRFTVGWYGLLGMMLVSNLVVMLALIAESNRLYARLALSMAARDRERDARLMSMDALTAAIAHEVGQPLTGAIANSLASLEWVTRRQPDVEKAGKALRAAIDDGNRTAEVIASIRGTFAKGPIAATEFSLNDLVRETAAFLDRELAGEKVSLELTLDEELPPILADRVQIQRVLVNLFTNAIESLGATRRGPRRIAIRSAPLNGEEVLLEVSDTGIGIAPGEETRIFDAFFTTKAAGTGLGLSLCRTIVEEHGGRLWASAGKQHGATFHLQLPRSALAC
jgi:signal transduction histidine kinase